MVFAVALGVWLASHQVESSRKVRVHSGMMPFGNTYVVNGTGDGDQAPGTRGGCRDLLTGKCTLRAAIQLANASAGADDITFDIPTSDPGFSNGTLDDQPYQGVGFNKRQCKHHRAWGGQTDRDARSVHRHAHLQHHDKRHGKLFGTDHHESQRHRGRRNR